MSKLFVAILTVIIVTLIAGLGAFVYFTSFTPAAQAKKIATEYIKAVRADDAKSVSSISKVTDNETTLFFHDASLRDYKLSSAINSGSTYYFLYSFTDKETPKFARLAIENNTVVAIKTGDKLGATPEKDGKENNVSKRDDSTCLTSQDLAYIDSSDIYAHTFRAMTMEFVDGTSMKYAGKENGDTILNRLSNFYKKSSEKDYLIELRGYATDEPNEYITMTNFAQKRADQMKKTLIKKGITPDRIQISKPTVYPADENKDDSRRKMIDINIINQCR